MKKILVLLLTLSLVLLLVAACGGGGKEAPGGDMDPNAAAGKALFEQTTLEGNPGCVTCHSIEPGKTVVGPSMAGIASKGEDFIRESIVNPDADITEGFPAGTMPQDYGQKLSEEQINQLVAYLMTLK
ncbi:MAG TPA: cytochrome c [Caldilineae bacterium]|nr:cytochrome c [Caldilineae bacterium]